MTRLVTATLLVMLGCGTATTPAVAPVAAPATQPEPPRPEVELGTCFEWQTRAAPDSGVMDVLTSDRLSDLGSGAGIGAGPTDDGLLRARKPHRPQGPSVRAGNPVARGSLDPNIIRRIIRRHLPRLRYCYARELVKRPTLAGQVVDKFIIDPRGRVSSATAIGLDPKVSSCLVTAMRAMVFPAPAGGGIVTVSYPFIFKPVSSGPTGSVPVAEHKPVRAPPRPPPPRRPPPPPPRLTERDRRQCVRPVIPEVLADSRSTLRDCFAPLLAADARAVARLRVVASIDKRGAVISVVTSGSASEAVTACVDEVVAGLRFHGLGGQEQRKLACSLVLSNPEHEGLITDTLELGVTHGALELRGRRVADTYDVKNRPPSQWMMGELFRQLGNSRRGDLAITSHPTIDGKVIEYAVRTAAAAGFHNLRFARAVGTTKSWKAVNPWATPDWGCGEVEVAVRVRVTDAGIDVKTSQGTTRLVPVGDEHDFAGYRELIARLRGATTPPGRSDIAIAVGPRVPYRVFLNLVEIAVAEGFFDAYSVPFTE